MRVVALITFNFFHNRQQHAVFRNQIYKLDYIESDDSSDPPTKYYVLKQFPGTELPEEVFRPVDYKFGRDVAKKIEAMFPY